MKRAYALISKNPNVNRINIELEMEGDLSNMEKSLNIEREALKRSVRYCREALGIGASEKKPFSQEQAVRE